MTNFARDPQAEVDRSRDQLVRFEPFDVRTVRGSLSWTVIPDVKIGKDKSKCTEQNYFFCCQ